MNKDLRTLGGVILFATVAIITVLSVSVSPDDTDPKPITTAVRDV